jgi:hypothetical protein
MIVDTFVDWYIRVFHCSTILQTVEWRYNGGPISGFLTFALGITLPQRTINYVQCGSHQATYYYYLIFDFINTGR